MTHSISRRVFVKTGSAAIAAFNILKAPEARAAQPIRVGVVGCGGRGKAAAENAIRAADGVKITALADLFPQKIEEAKERLAKSDQQVEADHCFVGWDGFEKLIQTDVDYVILTTPPVFRPQMLEAAVAAGKHVFMEKPAAIDAPGIRRIITAGEKAKQDNLSIVAGTQRRHQPNYIETIKRLQDGAIGEIVSARAIWCTGPIKFSQRQPEWSDVEYQIRNWYHFQWLSGDHIVEQHVHNLDVISWVLGQYPERAFGQGGRAWQQRGDIWDHHAVTFEYGNGLILESLASQFPRPNGRVEEFVRGTKGYSNCSDWIHTNSDWKFEGRYQSPYIQEHTNLIASIRNNDGINEAESCAKSTMVGIMGRMAEYSGKTLSWDEAFNSDETLGLDKYAFGDNPPREIPIPGGADYTGTEGWDNDPVGKQP